MSMASLERGLRIPATDLASRGGWALFGSLERDARDWTFSLNALDAAGIFRSLKVYFPDWSECPHLASRPPRD